MQMTKQYKRRMVEDDIIADEELINQQNRKINKQKKKETFVNMVYKNLGQFFATIFLFLCGILCLALIVFFLAFVYMTLELFQDALPIIVGFVLGYSIVRWSR